MKLSVLQKYILKQCLQAKDKTIDKKILHAFYNQKKFPPKSKDIINIITKSVERLIRKEVVVGFGEKTSHKWFIKQVKLTPKGRKMARMLMGVQQKLPFKNLKFKK
ncbi:MAG TPA: hypothetical protein VJG65_00090 [Patescibacteria group bacterium]|nr:hypothetical protein [Patescibacteria group bacterium]